MRITLLLGQIAGARIGIGCFGRIESLGGEQHKPRPIAARSPSVASRTFRQCRQYYEAALKMADCFEMGQSRRGMLPRLQPLIDRALGVPRRGQVMGE